MSESVIINGEKYIHVDYLQIGNNTAKRRGRKIKQLEAEIALLNMYMGCEGYEIHDLERRIEEARQIITNADYELIYRDGFVEQVIQETANV